MFRENFAIWRNRGDFTYLALLFILVVLPVHYKYLPPFIIMLCLGWIIENHSQSGKKFSSDSRYLFLALAFVSFYLWQFAGILYTSNTQMGWSNIFGRLSFLIFPLTLFSPGERVKANGFTLLRVFAVCTAAFILTCYGYALFRSITIIKNEWIFNPHPPDAEWLNYFYGPDLTYSIHPSYLAMYVLISAFISFESWYDRNLKKSSRWAWILLGIFLFMSIYFISSRAAIIAGLIMILFYALNKILILKRSKAIWIGLIILLLSSLPLMQKNDRVNSLLTGFSGKQKVDLKKQDDRIIVWESALEIFKKNPIFGVGIGDVRSELVKEYTRIGDDSLSQQKLNAHNQFLEILVENGLIGFSMFLIILGQMIFIAIKEKNLLYGLFIIMMIVFFTFETTLYRLAGISFFSLFSFLLLYARARSNI